MRLLRVSTMSRLKVLAAVCVACCSFAISVKAQAAHSPQIDPQTEANKIVDQAFTKCPAPACSDASYYMEMSLPVLACNMGDVFSPQGYHELKDCRAVFQYKDPKFGVAADKLSPADVANGFEWSGYVTVNYQISRVRHIADGVWGPWEQWRDKPEARPYLLVHYWYKGGQWTVGEVGPDLVKIPVPFNDVIKLKPAYADIADSSTHAERPKPVERVAPVPIDSAEAQRREIPAGMTRDSLTPLYVCYSITPTGQCQRTGETVEAPGDLAVPLNWSSYYPGASLPCSPKEGVPVSIKNPNDNRPRYLRCSDAMRLARIQYMFVNH